MNPTLTRRLTSTAPQQRRRMGARRKGLPTLHLQRTGIMPLREAISAKLKRENRVDADPGDRGGRHPRCGRGDLSLDNVHGKPHRRRGATPRPGVARTTRRASAWPEERWSDIPLHESLGFRPEMEEVANLVTKKTKAILINSPSNPTGSGPRPERPWRGLRRPGAGEGPPRLLRRGLREDDARRGRALQHRLLRRDEGQDRDHKRSLQDVTL